MCRFLFYEIVCQPLCAIVAVCRALVRALAVGIFGPNYIFNIVGSGKTIVHVEPFGQVGVCRGQVGVSLAHSGIVGRGEYYVVRGGLTPATVLTERIKRVLDYHRHLYTTTRHGTARSRGGGKGDIHDFPCARLGIRCKFETNLHLLAGVVCQVNIA